MNEATPRITAAYLEQFQNQTVRVLGKVVQLRGEHATVEAGGQMSVLLNRVSFLLLLFGTWPLSSWALGVWVKNDVVKMMLCRSRLGVGAMDLGVTG